MAAIGWTVTVLVAMVGGGLLRGWVLSVLWGWFIVPTFNLPALAIAPAIGLSLVVGFLTRPATDDDERSKHRSMGERLAHAIALAIAGPLMALAMGWVVHLFMPGVG